MLQDVKPDSGLPEGVDRRIERCEAILRHQIGIDPQHLGSVLDLVALGIVNSAWRNSPVEDWHAHGGLSDGEMLRINAHTTWRVRQIMRRWRADEGLAPDAEMAALDSLDSDAIVRLATRIYRWLVTPTRRLPTGATLSEVAGDDLGAFRQHADEVLGSVIASIDSDGARYVLLCAAARGGMACKRWFFRTS